MFASLLHQVPASSNLEVTMQIIRYNSVSTLVMTASMQTSHSPNRNVCSTNLLSNTVSKASKYRYHSNQYPIDTKYIIYQNSCIAYTRKLNCSINQSIQVIHRLGRTNYLPRGRHKTSSTL